MICIFFHKNILKYENRPYKDVEEMNKDLIENWNKKVNKDDEVYILGDISFGGIPETVELLKQLNDQFIYKLFNNINKYSGIIISLLGLIIRTPSETLKFTLESIKKVNPFSSFIKISYISG